MAKARGVSEISPTLRAAVLRALAEALEDQYPGLVVIPLAPGETPRPGARVLPAVLPQPSSRGQSET